jgi:hypothetical protein
MSTYAPPLNFLTIFNQNEFNYASESVTLAYVNGHFLKLTGGILTGGLLCNSTLTGGSNFYINNGTVLLPSITFTSDTDTGIYRIGANNLGISCNAAKVLDISTTGLGVIGALSSNSFSVDQIGLDNSTITLSGTTANNILSIPDNLADSFSIKEGSNSYIKFTTTNAAESITLSKATTIAAALSADSLTVDQISLNNSTITLSGSTGANIIAIQDNLASALDISESSSSYLKFITTNSSESISFGVKMSNNVQPIMIRRNLTAQQFLNATVTTVVFGQADTSVGTDISYSAGTFTCNSAGRYLVCYSMTLDQINVATLGGFYYSYLEPVGYGIRIATARNIVTLVGVGAQYDTSGAGIINLATNDTFLIRQYQVTGATQQTLIFASTIYPSVQIYRLG